MKTRTMTGLLAAVLSMTILFTGCADSAKDNSTASQTNTTSVSSKINAYGAKVSVGDIKKAYSTKDKDIMPLYNVEPDESFEFDYKFPIGDTNDLQGSDFVTVHTDPSCSKESEIYVNRDFDSTKDGGTRVKVSPITGTLATDSEEDDMLDNDKETWGNATMYYIALWVDTSSDKLTRLDTPKIIPFTVKHDIPVPTLKGEVDAETGRFKLKWNKVEGAEKYYVYTYSNSDTSTGSCNKPVAGADKAFNGSYLIKSAEVEGTEFDNFSGGDHHSLGVHKEHVTEKEYYFGQNYNVGGAYFVTAVVNGKESALSNMVDTTDLSLPYKPVEEDDIMFNKYDDESKLPQKLKVLNIDGTVTERDVEYSFCWGLTYLAYEKDSKIDARVPEYQYKIDGTSITGFVTMDTGDEGNAKYSDKKEGDSPDGTKKNKATNSSKAEPENQTDYTPDNDVPTIIDDKNDDSDSDKTLVEKQEENTDNHIKNGDKQTVENNSEYEVFADSAEEEWLALNMINGNTEISLESFPSLQKYETLEDTLTKVYYQNPYVLGLINYKYDYGTLTLKINYCYDKNELSERQKKIKEESEKIVKDIIKDKMSDEEKCLAIYNYLNENTKYDDDAVKAAEKTNYKKDGSWKEHEDAFNAYGIIVDKKGVCQSYAYSYKLLCALSGVESKVLTGYLDDTLPHAWNCVKLDGEWYQTDCTNNETNCGVPFFLYESDDKTAQMTGYKEDKLFELDTAVGNYRAEKADKEYYASNGLSVSTLDEYKNILDKNLDKSSDTICIRFTGTAPLQEDIVKTVREVYNMHGMEDKLSTLGMTITNGFIILINK